MKYGLLSKLNEEESELNFKSLDELIKFTKEFRDNSYYSYSNQAINDAAEKKKAEIREIVTDQAIELIKTVEDLHTFFSARISHSAILDFDRIFENKTEILHQYFDQALKYDANGKHLILDVKDENPNRQKNIIFVATSAELALMSRTHFHLLEEYFDRYLNSLPKTLNIKMFPNDVDDEYNSSHSIFDRTYFSFKNVENYYDVQQELKHLILTALVIFRKTKNDKLLLKIENSTTHKTLSRSIKNTVKKVTSLQEHDFYYGPVKALLRHSGTLTEYIGQLGELIRFLEPYDADQYAKELFRWVYYLAKPGPMSSNGNKSDLISSISSVMSSGKFKELISGKSFFDIHVFD